MALLQAVRGPTPGERILLDRDEIILGRHPDCHIVLESAAVSRQHARIARESGQYLLQDLGSRNGTLVNGTKIQGIHSLHNGDRIVLCDLTFDFFFNSPSEMLAGPLPSDESAMAFLVDDSAERQSSSASISKLAVSSSLSSVGLVAKPEAKLEAMVEIAHGLGKAVALEEVLSGVLDSLFKIFVQADRGFVILQTPSGDLAPKAVRFRRESEETAARISRTIVQEAMTSQQAILSADAASDSRFSMAESITDFHIRSLMCAPLVDSDGQSLGVLQIDTLNQKSRFTEDDLDVLASVASQAAIAVDNAQLHEKALHQQAMEQDLKLARKVQHDLVPTDPPVVESYQFFHFYEPARQVGGDYYDYVTLPDGRIAIVLGDVSGKGVSAALLMAKLSGDVRFCLASEPDPAAAVSRINANFMRGGSEDRFVTFIVVVLDPRDHRFTLVNAGHMPPLMRRGGTVEEIGDEVAGLPLGVMDDYQYEAFSHHLEPGDLITLYTDGFSEAMNPAGELYGTERLSKMVGNREDDATAWGQRVLEDVRSFVSGHPQSDDMCLACFSREA